MSVWAEIAERLRRRSGGSVRRFRVRSVDPLVLTALDGDERLEQGDEDVEIDSHVLGAAARGDVVAVLEDRKGDFVVAALLGDEEEPVPVPTAPDPDFGAIVSSVAQAIPHNAWQSLQFDVAPEENIGGMYDGAVSRFKFVVKRPGIYSLNGTMKFVGNATGTRFVHLEVNDVTVARHQRNANVIAVPEHLVFNVATTKRLQVGDEIKLRAWQNSGAALNTVADTFSPRLTALWERD